MRNSRKKKKRNHSLLLDDEEGPNGEKGLIHNHRLDDQSKTRLN